jgi:hypothetical protein
MRLEAERERGLMKTAIVSGAIANKYRRGGAVWTRLNWVLGLRKLGFRVVFIEQIERANCLDSAGAVTTFEDCVNRAYFQQVAEQFGLSESAALVYDNGRQVHGPGWAELLEAAGAADLLLNITGHLTLEPLKSRPRRKVYVDLDPGYTQFWHAAGNPGPRLEGHDYFFTVGENIGKSGCPIPTGGVRWRPVRQPVVLEEWPVSADGPRDRFTTVASWRGPYGPVQQEGTTFGLKVHEFRKFIELPRQVPATFEIALDIHAGDAKDLQRLRDHGWRVVDPTEVAADPSSFRRYVQASGAEFSVAQGIYVQTGSGWFSDRTVRYLASGKPALVQDTGFSRNYPVGEGLVAFRTPEEAGAGAEAIRRDYPAHCRAARALAETYFDSDKVLGRLLEEVGVAA